MGEIASSTKTRINWVPWPESNEENETMKFTVKGKMLEDVDNTISIIRKVAKVRKHGWVFLYIGIVGRCS